MVLAPRLEIRQSQQLVMTPQLQQAIKLLQLSNMDLSAYVEQELEKNPLLERGDADLNPDQPTETVREDTDAFGADEPASEPLSELNMVEGAGLPDQSSDPLDTDYDNTYTNDSLNDGPNETAGDAPIGDTDYLSGPIGSGGGFSDPNNSFEENLSEEISLQDHLREQLLGQVMPDNQRFIAGYLIDLISEAGYLTEDTQELSEQLGCPEEMVIATLDILRNFEPAGVFARDLGDCLALQLKERGRLDSMIQTFLDNLHLLADAKLAELTRVCGTDQEDIMDMVAEIRTLDPKPGLQFGSHVAQTVVPDVFVNQNPDGSWKVELNSETLPRVLVNNRYHAQINTKARKKEEKEFISECLNTANWLVKSLDQRANTILKVASELVRQQEMFFTHGITHLKPLNLKAIADAIEMHESTVSRVTSNKFIASPRGTFELKYFFTSAIGSTGGGDVHSAESVKYKLKQLVDAESPSAILSDDKIVELMKKEGIDIARRTVAKYRDALNIPSSVQRRRQKKKQFA
ncbi:RNA polymerase factor sigma-54 [Sneathiella sp. P13V-1]|uniref:RNA polymerase factor sigma-54 n=1 Tax=Sneathiella sp. P13V-1 TaxID=2697366 RepID=UPI00187B78A7|nr:RNA polymerase factor sigma-54 [Sneathiella sp. P13V-1]MBE7636129.1 RNA polymerase factor sigma-54 [Sneathiella sp. P13V-1]